MSLYNCLKDILGQEIVSIAKFRYEVFCNYAVEVEGHCGLKQLCESKIALKLPQNKTFIVVGRKLVIVELSKRYALIKGIDIEVSIV
ncbi:MAG: hypothetical protein RR248_02590 [Clostridia bacterium]